MEILKSYEGKFDRDYIREDSRKDLGTIYGKIHAFALIVIFIRHLDEHMRPII